MIKEQFCCLRICYGKRADSATDKSGGDVRQIAADEVSTASSNYARYYCAQNRLRQSPPASLNSQVAQSFTCFNVVVNLNYHCISVFITNFCYLLIFANLLFANFFYH